MGDEAVPRETLLEALVVTAEVLGHELSPRAAEAMARELAGYPAAKVGAALQRCQRELTTGRLTLGAVLQRIDDGRPGADEAWAMCPRDEQQTVVWTDEIAEAFGLARELEDPVAARMAFREAYARLLLEARAARRPVRWWASLGLDMAARGGALLAAVARKQLTPDAARRLVDPGHPTFDVFDDRLRALEGLPERSRLRPSPVEARKIVAGLAARLGRGGEEP